MIRVLAKFLCVLGVAGNSVVAMLPGNDMWVLNVMCVVAAGFVLLLPDDL